MNETDHDGGESGIRLSKRVAAEAACSRREAELLIENGAVRVDGEPVLLPQARVRADQRIEIEAGARPVPVGPVTLLLHKPAGLAIEQARRLLGPAKYHAPERAGLRFLPRHVAGQRFMTPIEEEASGLLVYTQEWRVERRLTEDAALLEHELMVDVGGPVGPDQLARLNEGPAHVSISQQAEGHTGLRFALKGPQPGDVPQQCHAAGLQVLAMRRLRIGRVGLSGLLEGQWRYLLPHERF
ncbi:rRNA pseudouridine synthase [Variovorax defluvii]|uniref:Dual-specificity RNA pseudouridine synthase RluF n=1 Tax=Variovorax defluvii TaxID=913761 RepID=A0ABP8I6X2_9BURK